MEKIKQFFRRNYFDNKFPVEYRIYMVFFFESYIIAAMAAVANTFLYGQSPLIFPQWLYVAVATFILFVKPEVRMSLQKAHLIFLTSVYIPFIYFTTAGYDGTAFLFSVIGIFALMIGFSGRQRIIVILFDILINLLCVAASYYFPHLVTPHVSLESELIDLVVSLVMAFVCMAVMTSQITKSFQSKNDELSEISNRDSLTGVYNRRFLFEYIESLLKNDLADQKICALMMDLDYFKVVNDTYGHGIGDEVLRTFTQTVEMVLRDSDVLARYGGEEFVALLHSVNFTSAEIIAERIRKAVNAIKFENGLNLTVSIGLAMAEPGDSAERLINRADNRLYKAKQLGRNRVCCEDL